MKLFPPDPNQYIPDRADLAAWYKALELYTKKQELRCLNLKANYIYLSTAAFVLATITYHNDYSELGSFLHVFSVLGVLASFVFYRMIADEQHKEYKIQAWLNERGYSIVAYERTGERDSTINALDTPFFLDEKQQIE